MQRLKYFMGKHLTAADRGKIEAFLQQNYNPTVIAAKLNRDVSVISREINNRSTPNGYFADVAQLDYETKRKQSLWLGKIVHSSTRNFIIEKLSVGWSPEQISGYMKRMGRSDYVCHETIYKFIYSDPYCVQGKVHQYLRYGRKARKKWNGRRKHRSKIPNRVSIHKRPNISGEFGHWEGDSVIYPYKKAINTLNELQSGYVEFMLLERKTADLTAQAMSKKLSKHPAKTLTVDNGSEFTKHEEVTNATGIEVYFCDPYSSWQRGANENANGLLRGYLPKRHNINELTQDELDEIALELNNRPRKRLGYKTPAETYQQLFNSS